MRHPEGGSSEEDRSFLDDLFSVNSLAGCDITRDARTTYTIDIMRAIQDHQALLDRNSWECRYVDHPWYYGPTVNCVEEGGQTVCRTGGEHATPGISHSRFKSPAYTCREHSACSLMERYLEQNMTAGWCNAVGFEVQSEARFL